MVSPHLVSKYDSDPIYSFQVMHTDRQTNSIKTHWTGGGDYVKILVHLESLCFVKQGTRE